MNGAGRERRLDQTVDASERDAAGEWALALFRRSVVKQAKYREIVALLDDPRDRVCLDVGADNGVISHLLRERGGTWHSADLDRASVEAIRALVGTNVHRVTGAGTPFEPDTFDLVVIVDFLEHIHEDATFAGELARIMKPGAVLIVNVPHRRPHSLLNRVRHAIGLTDEKHGHVRPGYTLAELTQVLGERFRIERHKTYSRVPLESLDTALNFGFDRLREEGSETGAGSPKGGLFTRDDWAKHRRRLRLLTALYPAFWTIAWLDRLWVLGAGFKLIVRARLEPEEPLVEPERSPASRTTS